MTYPEGGEGRQGGLNGIGGNMPAGESMNDNNVMSGAMMNSGVMNRGVQFDMSRVQSGLNEAKVETVNNLNAVSNSSTANANNAGTGSVASAGGKVSGKIDFLKIGILLFLKPVTMIREEKGRFGSFKKSAIVLGLVSVMSTLANVLNLILTLVIDKECTGRFNAVRKCKTVWNWKVLEGVNFLDLTIRGVIGFTIAVLVVMGIFYAVSRIMKQSQVNYSRMVAIMAISAVPFIIGRVIGTLVGGFDLYIAQIISTAGMLYGFYIFYETINEEVGLIGDKKIFYNTICIVSLMVFMYILIKFVLKGQPKWLDMSILDVLPGMPKLPSGNNNIEIPGKILDDLKNILN